MAFNTWLVGVAGRWAKPNISVLGYAIYLAINATSLWGGVFPFFPDEFRTSQVTFFFVISQALSFLAMLLAGMAGSYWGMRKALRLLPVWSSFSLFIGSTLLIAALYLGEFQVMLVVLAGVFLGTGGAGFALSWQRYFSSLSAAFGNYYLLMATVCGTVVFLVLYLVPIAVTVYLVPLILVPLCGLCGVLSDRTIDKDQPLFEDVPKEHVRAYVQFMRDHWRNALAIGSLGFTSGFIRSILLADVSLGNLIIVFSMLGSLIASVILLRVWQHGTFALDTRTVFLVLFPLASFGLLFFPFLDGACALVLTGGIYAIFTFATLVMLLQCMQISRDRGMNPLFVFGFFGSIVYLMQDIGLSLGYATNITTMFGQRAHLVVALAGMFVLSMGLYLMRGDARLRPTAHTVEKVEFIGSPLRLLARPSTALAGFGKDDGLQEGPVSDEELLFEDVSLPLASPGPFSHSVSPQGGEEEPDESDEIVTRCKELQKRYMLTNRETEIMELFARGYSMPHIAELLVVSENTVRTHSKHLYSKLCIHKRQELIELLRQ